MHFSRVKFLHFIFIASIILLCYTLLTKNDYKIKTELMYQISSSKPLLQQSVPSNTENKLNQENVKTILYYTRMYRNNIWTFGEGQDVFKKHNCPVTNCLLTSNRSLLPTLGDFDALLFNYYKNDFVKQYTKGELHPTPRLPDPASRSPHQRYVLHMFDPPPYTQIPHNPGLFNGYFNWTMTYRLDSDLPRPYGWFERHDEEKRVIPPSTKDFPYKWVPYNDSWIKDDMMKGKESKLRTLLEKHRKLGMVVSHCPVDSKRLKYAKELQKYIDVGILGRCGNESCNPEVPFDSKDLDNLYLCKEYAQENFKYFLSFENSLCDYYSSEKFWKHGLQNGLVPIVMGRGFYKDVAPPHSYIDVSDFDSPKALAAYIEYLERNPLEYLSYFWWWKYYRVRSFQKTLEFGAELSWVVMCEMCKKLNDPKEPVKVFNQFEELMTCHEAPDWTENSQG